MFGAKRDKIDSLKLYSFEFSIMYDNNKSKYSSEKYTTEQEAENCRAEILSKLTNSLSQEEPSVIVTGLVVRGKKIVEIWVGEVKSS